MKVISESLHRQRYKSLWDLLFDRHPHGEFIRGKWEGLGEKKTDVPPDSLILELLKKQPTALLLDEFQTWFDGLTDTKQYRSKTWAFNFIQILSEIAKECPELLVLVVSVRNGTTDAYQQIHRVNPIRIDFKGPQTERDRRRLLLHRLFENRIHVPAGDIEKLIGIHLAEYFRLAEIPAAEQDQKRRDFLEIWPFAPHLMQLLEDQVLVATEAQETRDLIRILADLFKSRGEASPVLTAADFRIDDESSGIIALLDSVANQHHATLREKAQRNLSSVLEAVHLPSAPVPHLSEIIGALWLRSLAGGNIAGANPHTLHIDLTRDKPIDDNAFQVELSTIVDNSFNIHQDGDRLIFREEENPNAKLMAFARNDRLFADGSDCWQLAREIRYVLGGDEEVAKTFRVIVLPQDWLNDPWAGLEASEHPDHWNDRLPILVLPEDLDRLDKRLGLWLKEKVQRRRNTIRFLLPKGGSTNAYLDRNLIVLARAVLKAKEWCAQHPAYGRLQTKYQKELWGIIKQRFNRFAVLRTWNFTDPSCCTFHVEHLQASGNQIPEAIEERLRNDIFVPEDFEYLIIAAAKNSDSIGKLLRELQEPRPNEEECIPWLGEILMKEKIVRLCARGKIAINLRGMEYLQVNPGESEEDAWRRMRGKLGTGKHLDETYVLLPQAISQTSGAGKTLAIAGISSVVNPPAPPPVSPFIYPDPVGFQGNNGKALGGATSSTAADTSMGSLFGGVAEARFVTHTTLPTSALNLLGKVEEWGVGPATALQEITIKLNVATGAQLQKLLRRLPDGLTYELRLHKEM